MHLLESVTRYVLARSDDTYGLLIDSKHNLPDNAYMSNHGHINLYDFKAISFSFNVRCIFIASFLRFRRCSEATP